MVELAFVQYRCHRCRGEESGFGGSGCTHFEVMRDGTPHFTLRLNGLLAYDLSGEVGLRWKGLPEKTSRDLLAGIWVFALLHMVVPPPPFLTPRQRAATKWLHWPWL